MVTIQFVCQHRLSGDDPVRAVCPTCGERRVSRVFAPHPRFRGTVNGPYAEYQDLPPEAVRWTKET
jgi:hypothetical protein